MCEAYEAERAYMAHSFWANRRRECRKNGHQFKEGDPDWYSCKNCDMTRKQVIQQERSLRARELKSLRRLINKYPGQARRVMASRVSSIGRAADL